MSTQSPHAQPESAAHGALRRVLSWVLLGLALAAVLGALTRHMMAAYFQAPLVDDLEPRPAEVGRVSDRLVVVVWDNVRTDVMFDAELLPNVARLREHGASGVALTAPITMTSISVRAMGTGITPDLENSVRNWDSAAVQHTNIFQLLHDRGGRTDFVGNHPWPQMFGRWAHTWLTVMDRGKWDVYDSDAGIFALADILLSARSQDMVLIHYVGSDHVAHAVGIHHPNYARKLGLLDWMLGEHLKHLDPEHDTLMLISDHGCASNGGHGSAQPVARRVPWVLWGKGVRRGARVDRVGSIRDYASTWALLLGLPRPPMVEGQPMVDALSLDPATGTRVLLADLEDRLRYLGALAQETGTPAPPAAASLAGLASRAPREEGRALRDEVDHLRARVEAWVLAERQPDLLPAVGWWLGLLGLALFAFRGYRDPRSFDDPLLPPALAALAAFGVAGLQSARMAALCGWALAATWALLLRPRRGRGPSRSAFAFAIGLLGLVAFEVLVVLVYADKALLQRLVIPLFVATGVLAGTAFALRRRLICSLRSFLVPRPGLASSAALLALSAATGYYAPVYHGLIAMAAVFVLGRGLGLRRILALSVLLFVWVWKNPHVQNLGPSYGWEYTLFGLDEGSFERPIFQALALGAVCALAFLWWRRLRARSGRAGAARPLSLWLPMASLLLSFFATHLSTSPWLFDLAFPLALGTLLVLPLLLPRADLPSRHAAGGIAVLSLLALSTTTFELLWTSLLLAALSPALLRLRSDPGARRPGAAGARPPLFTGVLGAALLTLATRMLFFAIFEGRFNLTSVDVSAGYVGAAGELHLARAVTLIVLKFALPFLAVFFALFSRMTLAQAQRAVLAALGFLAARIFHMVLVLHFVLDHFYTPYYITGEFLFYGSFVLTLVASFGLYAWVRRSGLPWPARAPAPAATR